MAAVAPGRESRTIAREWRAPGRRRRGAVGAGQVALILGVVALALGGSGLAIALTHAGPAGARGPAGGAGDQGPPGSPGAPGSPGPGAIVNQTYDTGSTELNTTCAAYVGTDINFTVGDSGVLVVTASVEVALFHRATNYTIYAVSFGDGSATCNAFDNNSVAGEASGTQPTGFYNVFLGLAQSFPITAAGTYTVDVVGYAAMSNSSDTTYFTYASLEGVFYPA
jgi:hypothetical protein